MATTRIPDDGQVRLGPVTLPPGRRVTPEDGAPIAWVTENPVPRPGQAWSALRDLHPNTGLVPVLLDPFEPWDSSVGFGFEGALDPDEIDRVDPAQVLAEVWRDDETGPPPKGESDLAPAGKARLPPATLTAALDSIEAAHIGLVPARRPADVPVAVGWLAFDDLAEHPNGIWIGAVLRSWEDRFGAILLKIGPGAIIRLLVERPPRALEAARKLAGEHKAFADEYADQGPMPVSLLAPLLVDAPIWSFWWD